MSAGGRLLVLDCDSTLSAIEGVDELARARGPEVLAAVEALTHAAMGGSVRVEEVFARRLDLIRPTRAAVDAVGRHYLATIEPTASDLLAQARSKGWTPAILSGGFTAAIQPLADHLGIERVEAVGLRFDESGNYLDFDRAAPTSRSGGKNEVLRRWRRDEGWSRMVLVGDGASDLETRPDVDLFIGYGGYVVRPKVQTEAAVFVRRLIDVLPHL